MSTPIEFKNLSLEEKKDLFINKISGDEHEEEMFFLISLFTAYNIKEDLYVKHFQELNTVEMLNCIRDCFADIFDAEDIAWECSIETLGEKIFDLIDNFETYMEGYLKITHSVENIEDILFKLYTSENKIEVAHEVPVQEQQPIVCSCGHKNDSDANFCEDCGTKLNEVCISCWKHGDKPFNCGSDKC